MPGDATGFGSTTKVIGGKDDRTIRTPRDRTQMAKALGARRLVPGRDRPHKTQALCADHASLSQRQPAHRSLVRDGPQRRACPLHAHAGLQRPLPHRVRRLWPAGRERRHPARYPSPRMDAIQHREHAAAAAKYGRYVRLGARGGLLPARLLPLDRVVLPQTVRHGAGLPQEIAG